MNGAESKAGPLARPRDGTANASPRTTNTRAIWHLAIGIAGLIYLGVVLFADLYSPVFGVVLIVLAGYEVLGPHCRRR